METASSSPRDNSRNSPPASDSISRPEGDSACGFGFTDVGYQNNDWLKSNFYIMGMQFEKTNGNAFDLKEVNFGDIADAAPYYDDDGDFLKTAAQIQISNRDSEGFRPTIYFIADGSEDYTMPGWVDEGGNEITASIPIESGIGFWFRDPNASSAFNSVGQIIPDSPYEKPVDAHFRQLVCPFPKTITLADIDFGDIAKTAPYYDEDGEFLKTAAQIQLPNDKDEGFRPTIYFIADGSEDYTAPGWVDEGGNEVDPRNYILPAGRGCWFKANTDLTVTFSL